MSILRGGISVIKHTAATAAGTFTIPTPPASSSSDLILLAPEFTAGPTSFDPYRPWSVAGIDGLVYIANGFDQPQRWNGASAQYNMGAASPTTFSISLVVGAATFANGTVHNYYLVFYNSVTGKETAPQLTAAVPGVESTNTSGAGRDFKIDWTDPVGEYDKARVYRRAQNADGYFLVSTTAIATATYTDTTVDATLITNAVYIKTYRPTLPPIFDWIEGHQGRLFGGFRDSTNVHYSQATRIDAHLRIEDFPDASILQPGSEDGSGGTVKMLSHNTAAYFFQRRGCYEMTGSEPATWAIRRINSDRGCIARRCALPIDENALVLDEKGLYWWTTSGEAIVAGAASDARESPLQPTWDRMNLGAADTFFALLDPRNRTAYFFIALDFEPIPNVAVVFDYSRNIFVGIDTMVWSQAGGILIDASGRRHVIRACDMGYAWEMGYAESEGVFAGASTGVLTAANRVTISDGLATFNTTAATGVIGAPMERYETDGTLLDQNRVSAAAANDLAQFYFPTDLPAIGQSVAIGVIPAVARTPRMTFGSPEKKWVRRVIVEHDNGVAGNLRADTGINEASLVLAKEFDLTTNIRTIVPVADRCWTWTFQISQRYANLGFAVRGVTVQYVAIPGQRQ